jgi:hypothetical protein
MSLMTGFSIIIFLLPNKIKMMVQPLIELIYQIKIKKHEAGFKNSAGYL